MPRQLHLNAFLMNTGHHEASWRLPESNPYAHVELEHYTHLARIAERGTFDSLFLADGPQLWSNLAQRPAGALEPLTLLTALATATEHIGLIATASTSYNSPYNLARKFASLDIISGGRAGWNIVTTAGAEAARNFGLEHEPAHAERYARAAEFLDVALKLWDSWEDDAIVADKAAGVWGDDTKIHPPRHQGTYFSVAGALNVPRSPQGYPCSCRRVRAMTARRSRRGTRRRCSPRSRPSPTPRPSTRISSPVRRRPAGTRSTSRCCPGSCPCSAGRRPRPEPTNGCWRTTSCTRTAWTVWNSCCNCLPGPWSWTPRSLRICRPRTPSRARRAGTRSSSNWPVATG